ncbi:hypothetical protein KC315_g18865, partial [Hortaea werneckii]
EEDESEGQGDAEGGEQQDDGEVQQQQQAEDGEGEEEEGQDQPQQQKSSTTAGGTADDDTKTRKISVQEAQQYADEEGLLFFETSAKSGLNVNEVFTAIANAIPETSLKGARGGATAGGGGGGGSGAGGTQAAISAGADSSRVNLNARQGGDGAGAKEGCAC